MTSSSDCFTCRAFLLTGESQDRSGQNQLRFYGRSPEIGPVEILIEKNRPVFFIDREAALPLHGISCERSSVALRSLKNQTEVDALYFKTQKDLTAARDTLHQSGLTTYEADIYPSDRFLMERFICAQTEITGTPRKTGGLTSFTNPQLKPAAVTPELRMASLDIETGVQDHSLYSIAVHITGAGREEESRIFMLASGNSKASYPGLTLFETEGQLLQNFLLWFQEADPDVLIGWNVVGFDLAFLEKKCREHGVLFELGRSKRPALVKKRQNGGLYAILPGRVVFDGPMALRTSFYSFEDFTLETVSQNLLGEGKRIAPHEDKIRQINHLFQNDKTALADYNLQDCVLVTRIFQKTGLMELFTKRSQISGLLLDQIGLSTAAFDHFYLPRLHRRGYVASNVSDIELREHAAGGYVISPQSGLYDHVILLDFQSLYPSIIRTFSIDPLSRLLADRDSGSVATPKGFRFSKKEAILPDFIKELMELRAQAQTQKDAHLSTAIKILMNSFYGVMGSGGCRFYHPDLPTAITSTGQWLLLGSKAFLESQGYEVLYGDTDSLFVKCREELLKSPDEHGKKLADTLTDFWKKDLKERFQVTSFLKVKYEKYYRRYALPRARNAEGGAKKRYAGLRVTDGKESLEFIGMEFVRSDWTKLAKEFQETLYGKIFRGEDPSEWIRDLVRQVREGRCNDKLVYRKRLRKGVEEYTKTMPPHVKAALQMENPGREIRYLMTLRGPVPEEQKPKDIDYAHYVEKQLQPIADSILGFIGLSFESFSKPTQFSLFPKA